MLRRAEMMRSMVVKLSESNANLRKTNDELVEMAKPNNSRLEEMDAELSTMKSEVDSLSLRIPN